MNSPLALTTPLLTPALPGVAPDLARAWTALAGLAVEGRMTLAGEGFAYAARSPHADPSARGTVVDLRVDGAGLRLAMNADPLDWLLDEAAGPVDAASLGPARAALVLEHLLTPDLEALEDAGGPSIAVGTVSAAAPYAPREALLTLDVTTPDGQAVAVMVFPDPGWDADDAIGGDPADGPVDGLADGPAEAAVAVLSRFWPERPARELPQIRMDVVTLGPLSHASRADVARLEPGAVYCPAPDWLDAEAEGYALIGGRTIVAVRMGEDGLRLDGPERPLDAMRARLSRGGRMPPSDRAVDRDGDGPPDGGAGGAGSLADPSLLVTVEFDRREMTVSEIAALQRGGVLDLGLGGVGGVTLCADGVPVAEGRLVQLDGTVGVQITRLV